MSEDPESLQAAVEEILEARVRPMLKMHGGDIRLAAIEPSGRVKLEWRAACRGCPLRPVTTYGLIKPELEAIDGVTAVDTGFKVSSKAAERLGRIARARRP